MPSMSAPAAAAVKETKAQKSERLKLAKNPWDAWDEVREFAREGRESVLPEWAGTYFKWWGIYTQGDGVGATGGVGGEGKATEFFMMRIGLPNGILTSPQLRVIGELTKKYARNLADITTRQNIQLHWLTIEALPEVVDALTAVGLSPKGACGDVVRNVTGCSTWCSYPEINDVALTAIKRMVDGKEEVGYTLRVGGGLSTEPHLAVRIPAFIRQDQAYAAVHATAEIFREQQELRENRTRARIKYLFMRHGWTAESFLAALEEKLGYKLDPSPTNDDVIPDDIYRDHIGIAPQRQAGLSSVGASVLRGRISGEQLVQLADLPDRYGNGELRTTIMQNILIVNVPNAKTADLVVALNSMELHVDVSAFW